MTANYGFSAQQQRDANRASQGVTRPQEGSSPWDMLSNLLGNLDRPSGAVRAGLTGNNPVQGFMNPQDYHLYAPTDSPMRRMLGGAVEGLTDPLNLLGAKYLSPLGKDASYGARVLAEGAQSVAARGASDLINENMPENSPDWLKFLGPVAGGLVAGGATAGGLAKFGRSASRVAPGALEDIAAARRPAGALSEQQYMDNYGKNTLQRPGNDIVPPGYGKLTGDEYAANYGKTVRSWISPTGEEVDLGPLAGTNTKFHNAFAQAMGATDEVDLISKGWVRKADVGTYQADMNNPVSRAQVEASVNADLRAGIRPREIIIDGIEADPATGGPVSQTFTPPPPGKTFSLTPGGRGSLVAAYRNQTPEETAFFAEQEARRLAVESNPSAVLAAETDPMNTTGTNGQVAVMDDLAKQIRSQAAISGGSGEIPPTVNAQTLVDQGIAMEDRFRAGTLATGYNEVQLMQEQFKNLPDRIKSGFAPTWVARIFNGLADRNPIAYESARGANNYLSGQKSRIAPVHYEVDKVIKQEFGDLGEKVSLAVDAPNDIKRAFQLAQEYDYGAGAIGLIKEHPEAFRLTPQQADWFKSLDGITEADDALSRIFGMEVPEHTVRNYARHMVELLGPDGKPLPADSWVRQLGSERSFEKRRLFESWSDILNSAADHTTFTNNIRKAMEGTDDIEEVQRLQDLIQQGVKIGVRKGTFAEGFTERLTQSASKRAEAFAVKTLRSAGGDVLAENELKTLLNATRISDALKVPAQIAGALRGAQLRFDASLFGVQSWPALAMGRGITGGIKAINGDIFRTVATDEGWYRFTSAKADSMSRWKLSDLELDSSILEIPQELDLLRRDWLRKTIEGPGTLKKYDKSVLGHIEDGLQYIDKVQFGRMATIWKLDMADHAYGLMKAARDGHMGFGEMLTHPSMAASGLVGGFKGQTDEALRRASASFTNNAFGGLNRTAQGRSAVQNLVESLFILTPGFTRGTVSLGLQAGNLLKWTPEAALARDFAVRGTLMAGAMVTGLSAAINGIWGDGTQPEVNVTRPDEANWMAIPLPGGRWLRPLSRFTAAGRITGKTVDAMLSQGPMAAAQMFSNESLRWATYRQSSLISASVGDIVGDVGRGIQPGSNYGNQYAQGQGVLNLLTNPEEDRLGQIGKVASNVTPVWISSATQQLYAGRGLGAADLKDLAFVVGAELMGQGQSVPTALQRNVLNAAGELAQTYGVPQGAIQDAIQNDRSPLKAVDANGQYFLSPQQRSEGAEKVAAQLGTTAEIVRRDGNRSQAEKVAELDALDKAQTTNFFAGMDHADAQYAAKMKMVEGAAARGMPMSEISKFISDARSDRAAVKDSVEKLNPLALAFLQDPKHLSKENDHTTLMKAISTEVYSKDFFDAESLSYDFNARDEWFAKIAAKYGGAFDEWKQNANRNKTGLELQRDEAFQRLGTYFKIADETWNRTTGGALGETEQDFDHQMRQMLLAQGVQDAGMQSYLLSQIKSNIPAVKLAHTVTTKIRNMMRASDPTMEDDVTTWLGAQPIATKQVSKADRALLNNLLVTP